MYELTCERCGYSWPVECDRTDEHAPSGKDRPGAASGAILCSGCAGDEDAARALYPGGQPDGDWGCG